MVAATFPTLFAGERPDRQPEVCPARKRKTRRHDTDHDVRTSVEGDRMVHHSSVSAKPALPKSVAQKHKARRARLVVGIVEKPSEGRFRAQRGQGVRRDANTGQAIRLAFAREIVTSPIVNADVIEDRLLRPPIAEVRVGDRHSREIRAAFAQPDESFGFRVRQGTEQHGIHDAEDRRVRSDAQRESEHGHGGEAGILQELAQGVAKVVHGRSSKSEGRNPKEIRMTNAETGTKRHSSFITQRPFSRDQGGYRHSQWTF